MGYEGITVLHEGVGEARYMYVYEYYVIPEGLQSPK